MARSLAPAAPRAVHQASGAVPPRSPSMGDHSMTDATRRLIQNLRPALRAFTPEQLYELARGLGDELAFRDHTARLEARALECALLPWARAFHEALLHDVDSEPA